jgi:hypothetical protein
VADEESFTVNTARVKQVLKQSAEDMALALKCSKQRYRMALDALESISDEVHEQRRMSLLESLPPRTPGVGAEATDELADWPSTIIGEDKRLRIVRRLCGRQFNARLSISQSVNV